MVAFIDRLIKILKKHRQQLVSVLIFIGLLLRIYNPLAVSFGFDQVQILQNAQMITQGDITLIGPRTGPADMFTGPLIYYVAAPFVLLFGDVLTVVMVPLFTALLTGMAFYWLMRRYVGMFEALLATLIWAVSPFLISLDRIFWNPNFTVLATLLLFLPLLKERQDKLTVLLFGAGAFLTYQAHFSGFLLLGLALFWLIYLKKPARFYVSLGVGTVLSILPTVLFDLRNNFLNAKGLVALLTGQSGFEVGRVLLDSLHNFYVITETTGKLFVFGFPSLLIVLLGTLVLLMGLRNSRQNTHLRMVFYSLLIIGVSYSLYRGEKPEYYFSLIIPLVVFVITISLRQLHKRLLLIGGVLFTVSAMLTTVALSTPNTGLSLGNIQGVVRELQGREVQQVIFDVPAGSQFGLNYFLAQISLVSDGEIVHIAYPDAPPFSQVMIGRIGIWSE